MIPFDWKWYRRMRGGRWATVTGWMWGRRWVRVTDAGVEPVEEDYRPRLIPMGWCFECWGDFQIHEPNSACPWCGGTEIRKWQAISKP